MCTMRKMASPPRLASGALFLITVLLLVDVSPCRAASQKGGAALYRKHCSYCHPKASTLRMSKDLLGIVRMPPLGMPAFSEDKLSNADVQTLGEYIRPAGGKVPQPASVQTKPLSATAGTGLATMVPASASPGTEGAPVTGRQTKTQKPWNRGFAGSWTIKAKQDGEVITIQQFVIAENANGEPECIVSNTQPEHSVKVTKIDITDKTLKLELTWSWNLNLNYWKIETFDLRLSDDEKKLKGMFVRRTSGGYSATAAVWAE